MEQPTDRSNQELLHYLLLSFFIAWGIWVPIYFEILPKTLIPFGFVGPIAAATLLTYRNSGKQGLRTLYSGLIRFKVRPIWYLALFTPALLTLMTHGIFALFFKFDGLTNPGVIAINFLIISIFLILEEVGWRGYALPRLQKSRNALESSLILGGVWALWHFPFWTISPITGAPEPFYIFYITGSLGALAMAVILTWIYNNTRQSILMTTMCHASFNATIGAMTFTTSAALYHNLIFVTLSLGASVMLVGAFGKQRLSKH